MIGGLDRRPACPDYRIGAAYGTVETAYAFDRREAHEEDAFLRLEDLIEARDALRGRWAAPERPEPDRPRGALFGPGLDEIPVCDPEALVW